MKGALEQKSVLPSSFLEKGFLEAGHGEPIASAASADIAPVGVAPAGVTPADVVSTGVVSGDAAAAESVLSVWGANALYRGGVSRSAALAEALLTPGLRRGAVGVEAPTTWQLSAFAGRLTEIAGSRSSAVLTMTFRLIYEAQKSGEPVAWIGRQESSFYPPDAADSGIDLSALAVIRTSKSLQSARVADHLMRSGGFGLIVVDLGGRGNLPIAIQTRLVGLAKKHSMALICLTEKESSQPSLGSLVSLRAQAERTERVGDRYRCHAEILKDKRRGPGWGYGELCRGPNGLR